jgi:hypothetical protein
LFGKDAVNGQGIDQAMVAQDKAQLAAGVTADGKSKFKLAVGDMTFEKEKFAKAVGFESGLKARQDPFSLVIVLKQSVRPPTPLQILTQLVKILTLPIFQYLEERFTKY